MKTITNIQRLLMIAGFITGLGLIDGMEVDYHDMWTGFILISLVMVQIIRKQLLKEEKENNKD